MIIKVFSVETIPGVVSGENKSTKDEKSKGGEEEEEHGIAPSYIERSRLLKVFKEIATKVNLLNFKTLCSLARYLVRFSSFSVVCGGR